MENRFKEYVMYIKENGKIVGINEKAFGSSEESFELFKELYNTGYGDIYEDENLISIHTGGWSENEEIIREFKETFWWYQNHKATFNGGHYYFDIGGDKSWKIVAQENN